MKIQKRRFLSGLRRRRATSILGLLPMMMAMLMSTMNMTSMMLPPVAALASRSTSSVKAKASSRTTAASIDVVAMPATPNVEASMWQFKGHDIYTEVAFPTSRGAGGGGAAAISTPPTANWFSFFFPTPSKQSSNSRSSKKKPTVLLVHGFGCSTVYWREAVATLTDAGYTVHAVDLLGQGRSAKPGRRQSEGGVEYSINLWAELIDTYVQERATTKNTTDEPIVVMGNSLGSLVALVAATGDFCAGDDDGATTTTIRNRVCGLGFFNCGIGLNSRNVAKEPQWNPLQRFFLNRAYDLFCLLIFNNIYLLEFVLDKVVTRELLRDALIFLYPCATPNARARVDDALVDSFYLPAKDAGSPEALSQIYVNDPGKTPMDLHNEYADILNALPIHLVWGSKDVVTPIGGGLGTFYKRLANEKENDDDNRVTLEVIESGHIPFDEVPEVANQKMLAWLEGLSR